MEELHKESSPRLDTAAGCVGGNYISEWSALQVAHGVLDLLDVRVEFGHAFVVAIDGCRGKMF